MWHKARSLGISVLSNLKADFYMIDNLSIPFQALSMCKLTLLSVDEILLPRYGTDLLISEALHLKWRLTN